MRKNDRHDDNGHSVALGIRLDKAACDLTGRLGHHSDGGIRSGKEDTSNMVAEDTSATGCEGREAASLHYLSLQLWATVAHCILAPRVESQGSLGLKALCRSRLEMYVRLRTSSVHCSHFPLVYGPNQEAKRLAAKDDC